MKNFITIILVLVSTLTFSQRKVETTYLRVKSLKNAELVKVDGKGRFKRTSIADLNIKEYQAGANITIDNTNPLFPIINASGGVPSRTNLSYRASPINGIVRSSTGTDAVIPLSTPTNAGLMPKKFIERWKETTTPVVFPHKDNVLTSTASFTFPQAQVSTYYQRVGEIINLRFKLDYKYNNIKNTDRGSWIVKIPVNNHRVRHSRLLPFSVRKSTIVTVQGGDFGGNESVYSPFEILEAVLNPVDDFIEVHIKIKNDLDPLLGILSSVSAVLTYSQF